MADQKNEKDSVPAAEVTYAVDDLIERSAGFLDCPAFVAAGALAGESKGAEMTIKDAKAQVKAWLKQPAIKEA